MLRPARPLRPWLGIVSLALLAVGCTAILGIDQDYTLHDVASGAATTTATGGTGTGTGGTGTGGNGAGGDGCGPPGPIGGAQSVDLRVANGADDVEECLVTGPHCAAPGSVYVDSRDLEMVDDVPYAGMQIVGIRFPQVGIPRGATITDAYIEFQSDTDESVATNLTFHGDASDDGQVFSAALGDVSTRARTTASVDWVPLTWTDNTKYQSPSLVPILQELVERCGWTEDSAVVFIVTGSGTRVADAYEGEPGVASLLHVEFGP